MNTQTSYWILFFKQLCCPCFLSYNGSLTLQCLWSLHLQTIITRNPQGWVEWQDISRKIVGKNVHATIPKGNMGYDQHTSSHCRLSSLLLLHSFSTLKHQSVASRAMLLNFFEDQRTQNHSRYLSGLSRALFLTIFREKVVFCNGVWCMGWALTCD